MKNNNVKMEYDTEADILSLENSARATIDHAQEMGDLVVHFSKKGEPILIEILQASKLFKRQPASIKKTIRRALTPARQTA